MDLLEYERAWVCNFAPSTEEGLSPMISRITGIRSAMTQLLFLICFRQRLVFP